MKTKKKNWSTNAKCISTNFCSRHSTNEVFNTILSTFQWEKSEKNDKSRISTAHPKTKWKLHKYVHRNTDTRLNKPTSLSACDVPSTLNERNGTHSRKLIRNGIGEFNWIFQSAINKHRAATLCLFESEYRFLWHCWASLSLDYAMHKIDSTSK